MTTKYNNRFEIDAILTEQHRSYIQTFLGDEINVLLAPSANQISQVNFDDLYIHNTEMENNLKKYLQHTGRNNTCIIEGLTGSGKTMLVRHVFGIHSWTARIKGNSIIIPLSFDNALFGDVKSKFAAMMHGACDCLTTTFPLLNHVDTHPNEFYTYIVEHRQDLLYAIDQYPTPSIPEQIKMLHDANLLGFYSSALKFYLNQTDVCTIDNIVIVIDDIEGIRSEGNDKEQAELLPVKMALELIECMQNKGNHATSWSLNTIISCRHFVSRMMRSLPFSLEENSSYISAFESYGPCDRYDLKNSPSLIDIIMKRYDALLKEKAAANKKWTTAMGVVKQLLETIDNKIADFILALTLGNNRVAMKWIKQLVLNKRWIQRDCKTEHPGAFEITDLAQYSIKPPALIRAIGMNESIVYNSKESIIPNLLYNDPNSETDLFVLLTLKHFLVLAQYELMSWDASFEVSHFLESIKQIFNSDYYCTIFTNSIHYLILHRLILRSYYQDQADGGGLNPQNIDKVEHIYISKLALDLWNRLSTTSVLFEMFVDDIWLNDDFRVKEPQLQPLLQYEQGFATRNFEVCLNYLGKLIDIERNLFLKAVEVCGNGTRYKEFFGSSPICGHLLRGLETALNAYYVEEPLFIPTQTDLAYLWRESISDLQEKCATIFRENVEIS